MGKRVEMDVKEVKQGLANFMDSCVGNLPDWASQVFEDKSAWFEISKSGDFSVTFAATVPLEIRDKIVTLLGKEIRKGGVFEEELVH